MTADWVQIIAGIAEGEAVIAYPGSRVDAGVRLAPRTIGSD